MLTGYTGRGRRHESRILGYGVRSDGGFDSGQTGLEKTSYAMQLVRGILERKIIESCVEELEFVAKVI